MSSPPEHGALPPPPDLLAHVAAHAERWRRDGRPDADLFTRLGASGFLARRWQDGRRPGLRAGLDLVRALAPLDGGVALAVSLHSEVFLATLHRFRSNPLVADLVERALTGEAVGAVGLTEDGGGSDPSQVTTRAELQPDGTWRLRGHKRYVSNLELATHCLVLTQSQDGGVGGPTLFVVDLRDEGVELVGTYDKLGTHSVGAWRVHLDVVVPAVPPPGSARSGAA
jgi:alkylation response protein AidB-like acyl-CoA dehydrogenase